jgi:LDH2 family malate/lactate/ureidoglycolate dehydrogenase
MPSEEGRVSRPELQELSERALMACGVPPEHARLAAVVLVLADCFGIHTHGVARIAEYRRRIELGGIDASASPVVAERSDTLAVVDGRNALGQVATQIALQHAMKAARRSGVAVAWVCGSNHFGPAMPYCYLAAEAGFASIVASNASTTMAPWGGREPRIGNNPLGIGVPSPAGEHVILDIAMSVAARAKLRSAAKEGSEIPSTWATDETGRPTTDPMAGLDGMLQPFGGHKGSGLSIMVDLLTGVLSGASYLSHVSSWSDDPGRPQDLGHVVLLVDVERLGPTTWMSERMTDFASIIQGCPPVDPGAPVALPGEREIRRLRQCEERGVELSSDQLTELNRIAATPAAS